MPATKKFLKLIGDMVVGSKGYGKFRGSDGAPLFEKAGWEVTAPCPGTGWEEWASEQIGQWLLADSKAVEKLLTAMARQDEFLNNDNRVKETERAEQVNKWNGFLAPHGLRIYIDKAGPTRVEQIAPTFLPVVEPKSSAGAANTPPEILSFLEEFRQRFPNPDKCIFIMMPFGSSEPSRALVNAVKVALERHGFTGLRADDHKFGRLLWLSIETYLSACRAGIAIFERLESDNPNPNVAFEAGYMHALRKPIGLFKEQTLRGLQTDLAGHIWYSFNVHDPASIEKAVEKWLREEQLL